MNSDRQVPHQPRRVVGELQFLRRIEESNQQVDDEEDHCERILRICKKGAD